VSAIPLQRSSIELIPEVEYDEVTAAAVKPFDLAPTDQLGFHPWRLPPLPRDFQIGVITGASGSGKSVLLREFGGEQPVEWQRNRSIASHFPSAEKAAEMLYAAGLSTIPTWRKPYNALSNGQQFRADLARRLGDGAVVDEFTSVVDRNVAVAASHAIRAWATRAKVQRMVFASCHRDVVAWLRPDWVIDTDAGEYIVGEAADKPIWWERHIRFDRGGKVGYMGLNSKGEPDEQLALDID
jgi:hypothetical protein